MLITIIHNDGSKETIIATGPVNSIDDTLEAHGIDPTNVETQVTKSPKNRLKNLELATGVNGNGKNGIGNRIDSLENRIENLESYHSQR